MNGFSDKGLDEGNFGESKGLSVSAFDAFPKTKQTYLTQTNNGGVATVFLTLVCIWLTATELSRWMAGTTTHTFSVEKGIAHDLQMNLDIVVAMKCQDLRINVQDASGDRIMAGDMLKKDATMWAAWGEGRATGEDRKRRKEREQRDGETPVWMQEQAQQYKKEEDVHEYLGKARGKRNFRATPRLRRGQTEGDACRIFGSMEGNKVQGDFHITARGHGYQEFGEHLDHSAFNFSHHINELSFGPFFPNLQNPLDAAHATTPAPFYKYQYYLSIVPTIYTDAPHRLTSTTPPATQARAAAAQAKKRAAAASSRAAMQAADPLRLNTQDDALAVAAAEHMAREAAYAAQHQQAIDGTSFNPFAFSPHTIYTNQYAVTEQSHVVPAEGIPGLFFKYDFEPILLTVAEEWGGLLGLVVRCVNVVAGVLVAGGWVVRLVDWAGEVVRGRRRARSSSAGGLLHGGEKGS